MGIRTRWHIKSILDDQALCDSTLRHRRTIVIEPAVFAAYGIPDNWDAGVAAEPVTIVLIGKEIAAWSKIKVADHIHIDFDVSSYADVVVDRNEYDKLTKEKTAADAND